MPDPGCEHWRGILAMGAVGQSAPDDGALRSHLDGCPDCRAKAVELQQTAGVLALIGQSVADGLGTVDDGAVHPAPTVSLDAAVARILAGDDVPEPQPVPRRRRLLTPVLAAAATVVVVLGALTLAAPDAHGSRAVALSGPDGARASAVLTGESWGTSVILTDPGLHRGQVLEVAMRTEYGRSWAAGSYHDSSAGGVTVTFACALPLEQIRTISVTDSQGAVVLASR
jgi:hypothetical protein